MVFSLVAKEIDGKIMKTLDWHKGLLLQMSIEIHYVRPVQIVIDIGASIKR
jgi:hypothetical protein